MKLNFLVLLLLVACAKHESKKHHVLPEEVKLTVPDTGTDITDPLTPPDQQQQTGHDPQGPRNYNGVNVVLNYRSSTHTGLIRVKGGDAEKLHRHMALTTIRLSSDFVKEDLEAKVGKHIMCRPDTCWVYIDYKNGDVHENVKLSGSMKAPKLIRTYRGKNVEMQMINRSGRIYVEGVDAKALYSVMAVPEIPVGGKGSIAARRSGNGLACTRRVTDDDKELESYLCEVRFNHRTGSMSKE
jgi:hypothetical protein